MDDYDGQMMFGDLVGLKLPDIRLTGEEKRRKNLTQETCPDRGSTPGLTILIKFCRFIVYFKPNNVTQSAFDRKCSEAKRCILIFGILH